MSNIKTEQYILGQNLYWKNNGGQIYQQRLSWQAPNPRARPIDIETSAYALLYLTEKNDMSQGMKIVNWLVSQRNPNGGFSSTQVGKQLLAITTAVICYNCFYSFNKLESIIVDFMGWSFPRICVLTYTKISCTLTTIFSAAYLWLVHYI